MLSSLARSATPKLWALLLLSLLPLFLQAMGLHWVRVLDLCLLYVTLALGMNIVVGLAGLLDLGYIAFYALGAYVAGLLTSPHLTEQFAALAARFPAGLQTPWWLVLPAGATLAALCGMLLGAPTLKLRGDYLAVVTLGFGEIVRLLVVNLSTPVDLRRWRTRPGADRPGAAAGHRPRPAAGDRAAGARAGDAVCVPAAGDCGGGGAGQPAPAGFADRPRLGGHA